MRRHYAAVSEGVRQGVFFWTDKSDFEGDGAAVGDIIDLLALDANAGVAGNQAFAFIGTAAFSAAGQLRYSQVGGETIIQANTNANTSTIEFELHLSGNHNLTGGDFIL